MLFIYLRIDPFIHSYDIVKYSLFIIYTYVCDRVLNSDFAWQISRCIHVSVRVFRRRLRLAKGKAAKGKAGGKSPGKELSFVHEIP